MTRRDLGDGFELDDDKQRVDLPEVHRYLCDESYWAAGRPYDVQERLVRDASRVVGLYHDGRQIGFCRAVSDGVSFAYLADVYVLSEFRGRGFGEALVREMIDHGPFAANRWLLHTTSMHPLYRKFGFSEPDYKLLERPRASQASDNG
ncbi:MAG: GNAT family N-acetyltransferase [Gaiellaceae bacterium]